MAMFVHLTAEKNARSILRSGISRMRKTGMGFPGIFAMPVTRNFYVSHQWLRELKRRGHGPVVGVYFRVPDNQIVWAGHYNRRHQSLTAAQVIGLIAEQESSEGYQIIIPRRIERSEIHRIRRLPQIVGWKHYPGAHGKKPCTCPICLKGEYGARKIREKHEDKR